jgi:hypothetical protein
MTFILSVCSLVELMTMSDLYPLYISLRDMMVRAAPEMKIAKDALGELTLNVPQDVLASKDPLWFGSVRLIKNTVSYYLQPLASKEGRSIDVPSGLKALSTSKTCFVFSALQPDRFAELEAITQKAAEAFSKGNMNNRMYG